MFQVYGQRIRVTVTPGAGCNGGGGAAGSSAAK
jgi:hypothetical protein